MKRSAGRLFIRVFAMSLFIVGVLMLTVVVGSKAIKYFSKPDSKEPVPVKQENVTSDNKKIEEAEGVTKSLIFCYDKKSDEITKMVLEILNSNSRELTYITIPVRTQITLSDFLYRKIKLDDPKIPQLLKLSTITKYLDEDKAYEDEVLIVEELLNININYYTAMSTKNFEKIFTERNQKQSDNYNSVPMETFNSEFKSIVYSFNSRKKIENYIKDIYENVKSNFPLEDKLKLIDSYTQVPLNEIKFDLIKGNNLNSAYIIDNGHAAQQLQKLIDDNSK